MLRDALLLAYCGLVGCASAGAAASFHRLVTARPARFAVMGRSWMAAFSSYLFFAVTGPAIVAAAVWRGRTDGGYSLGVAIGGIAVALVWSVCSGLVVLDVALSAGRNIF